MVKRRRRSSSKGMGKVLGWAFLGIFLAWTFVGIPFGVSWINMVFSETGFPPNGNGNIRVSLQVVDTPDPTGIQSATVYIWTTPNPTSVNDAIQTLTTGSDGTATTVMGFAKGTHLYAQAFISDYYMSEIYEIVVGDPSGDSGVYYHPTALVVGDMMTTSDISMGLTDQDGNTVDTGNALTYTDSALNIHLSGLTDGETAGFVDTVDGRSGKQIVQELIVVVQANYTINFAESTCVPVQNIAGDLYYVFKVGYHSASANIDGDGSWTITFHFTDNNYDGDWWTISIYANGDDLDTPIEWNNVVSYNFAGYTAVESDIIQVT